VSGLCSCQPIDPQEIGGFKGSKIGIARDQSGAALDRQGGSEGVGIGYGEPRLQRSSLEHQLILRGGDNDWSVTKPVKDQAGIGFVRSLRCPVVHLAEIDNAHDELKLPPPCGEEESPHLYRGFPLTP